MKKTKFLSVLVVLFLVTSGVAFSAEAVLSTDKDVEERDDAEEIDVTPPETHYTIFEDDFQWESASRPDSPFWEFREDASRVSDYSDLEGPIQGITVHHSAGTYEWAEDPADGVNQVHKNRDWPGAAYDFIIGQNGTIYHGGPLDSLGWHAGDYRNVDNIAICFEGQFNDYEPNEIQYEKGGHLIAYLASITNIEDERSGSIDLDIEGFNEVTPHDDWQVQGCPGEYFDPDTLQYYYEQYSSGAGTGEWHWMYDADHRTNIEYGYGGEESVWEGAMRIDVPPGEMTDIAFYAHSTPAYVKGRVHTDGAGGQEPGTQIAETETITEPGTTEWVEIPLTEPVTTEGGHHWIVLEVEDTGDWPFGYIQPYVEDAGWINLDGSWQTLEGIGEDFSWALEVRVEETTAIEDWYDLDEIRNGLAEDYYLANDLDSTTAGYDELVAAENGWDPIGYYDENGSGEFVGTLQGQGHMIKDLQINRSTEAVVGLFERIGQGAEIKDIGLEDVNVIGNDHVGGLVGAAYGGEISSSYVTGTVQGDGIHEYGDSTHAGGLVGKLDAGSLLDSYSSAEVTAAGPRAGGLIGTLGGAEIKRSYSYGQVNGDEDIGGLVGYGDPQNVTASFWDVDASGVSEAEDDSGCGSGLETAEMQQFSTFDDAGWDIESLNWGETDEGYIWNIVDGSTYPYLSWEEAPKTSEEYRLTVKTDGGGTTVPEPGNHTYEEGTEVTVEALPDEGWEFSGWTVEEENESEEGEDHVIYGFWPYWTDPADYDPDWDQLSHVSVFSMTAQSDGSLYEGDMDHYDQVKAEAEGTETDVTITVAQFDKDVQDEILAYNKQALADNIAAAIQDYGAEGVNIDLEFVRETNSLTGESNVDLMEEFLNVLHDEVKAVNQSHHISFCTAGGVEEVYRNSQLSSYADNVFLMGYDYHWSGAPTTGPVSPYDSEEFDVTDSMETLRGYYPDEQLVLGVPFYGYEWPAESGEPGAATEGSGDSVFMTSAKDNADQYGRNWDDDGSVPWYAYQEDGQWYQGWYDDEESLELKWEYVRDEGFGGTGFWAVGYETPETWDTLAEVFSGNTSLLSRGDELNITMDRNKTVTAHFEELEQYGLNISVEGEGSTEPEEGTHTYYESEQVDVRADAAENWTFVGWTGDVESQEENITVVMDTNKTVIAHFEREEYELTIETEGNGTTDPEPGTHTYSEGEKVDVGAFSDGGWYFDGWTGDHEGLEKDITVVMDREKTLTAHFNQLEEDERVLSIYIEGEGTTEPGQGVHVYEEGTELEVEASPQEGWTFVKWEGDVLEDQEGEEKITVVMDEDKTLTAHFEEGEPAVYELNVETTEGGEAVEPGEGSFEYGKGETVDLEAVPDEGYDFIGWSGDNGTIKENKANTTTIEMNDNHTVTAEFEESGTYSLMVEVEGEGSVEVDPDQDGYEDGTEVRLTAEPDEGWIFVGWSGDHEGEDNEPTITVDEDKEITAHFVKKPTFEVEIISPEDGEEFEKGEKVTVKYRVENTGGVKDTQDIELYVNDELVDSKKGLTLGPNESYEGEFEWKADEEGEVTLAVRSVDDEEVVENTEKVNVSVKESGSGSFWWPILLLLIVSAVVIAALMFTKKSQEEEETSEEERLKDEENISEE